VNRKRLAILTTAFVAILGVAAWAAVGPLRLIHSPSHKSQDPTDLAVTTPASVNNVPLTCKPGEWKRGYDLEPDPRSSIAAGRNPEESVTKWIKTRRPTLLQLPSLVASPGLRDTASVEAFVGGTRVGVFGSNFIDGNWFVTYVLVCESVLNP
jgi:hypothetical protein